METTMNKSPSQILFATSWNSPQSKKSPEETNPNTNLFMG